MTYCEVQEIIISIRKAHLKDKKWNELNCDELKNLYKEISAKFNNMQWGTIPENYQKAQADLVEKELNNITNRMIELKCELSE